MRPTARIASDRVDQDVVRKHHRPQHGNIRQQRNVQFRQRRRRDADIAGADQRTEAAAEDRQRQARSRSGSPARSAKCTANSSASAMPASKCGEHAQRGDPGLVRRGEGGDGAGQHHALDAEVQHAHAFHHQFAGRRQQQRRGGGDGADQEGNQQMRSSTRPSPGRARQLDPVQQQKVAAQQIEQQDALEDAGDRVRQARD